MKTTTHPHPPTVTHSDQTATVTCLAHGCPWTATGTPTAAETEQRRHTGDLQGGPVPGHASLLEVRP